MRCTTRSPRRAHRRSREGPLDDRSREPGAHAYWTVSDIAASVKALVAAGGTVVQEITDVGYGLLVASVKDPNGATVGLRQPPKG
ncbi:MAG TPA: VOC family protein [Candidatus Limnocylindria bacterium]|nr:VOC family protein [Candidatus Limnocylindria bacterium]